MLRALGTKAWSDSWERTTAAPIDNCAAPSRDEGPEALAEELNSRDRPISDGDLVIVYESYDQLKSVRVDSKKTLQNRFGTFPHADWIGRPFGCKVFSSRRAGASAGFVQLLAPTPELWTKVLPHRTQILYLPDIAVVISRLHLHPGCTVLESGTGSGSLTHSLARAVAPTGQVRTFDFHEQRAQAARDEFLRNGLSPLVSVETRDIQSMGFPPSLHACADAVFLDLPGPWHAVPSAASCLRPNGMFCSFSPCVEQVQRCCEALRQGPFTDLKTLEVLLRTYDIQTAPSKDPNPSTTDTEPNGVESTGRNDHQMESGPARPVWVRPALEARGHTGYLLFARRWV